MYDREKNAFNRVYKTYMNNVYGFASRMLNDSNKAEDVTQEVFLRLYRSLINGVELNNPRAWLMVLTRNLCLNMIRDTRKEVSINSVDILPCQKEQTSLDTNRQLNAAISRLEIKQREILLLKEYEGFSYSEIAEIAETSVAGVRSLLYRARLELKRLFNNKDKD